MQPAVSWTASVNEAIARRRDCWDARHPSEIPVLPFVTHALHPELAALVRRIGVRRRYRAGSAFVQKGSPVSDLALLENGVSARTLGSAGRAIAISLPGRIAFGNLNFFSGQPCFGSYYAVTECELTLVPQELMRRILEQDPGLSWLLCTQFELARQSDRLSLAMLPQLQTSERLKAFFLSWCATLGHFETDPGGARWISAPSPVARREICRVVNASEVSVNLELAAWRRSRDLESARRSIRVKPSLFEPVWDWILRAEEPGAVSRSRTLEEALSDFLGTKAP